MTKLDKLRGISERNKHSSLYQKFSYIYDNVSPSASGQFLRQQKVFDSLKKFIDYTEGQRGYAFKGQELFALRFPDKLPICKTCRKPTMWHGRSYSTFCSTNCSNKDPEVMNKKVITSVKNWGTENPNQSKIIQDKSKRTNLRKFGVEHPAQSETIMSKMRKTSLERHGVDNIFKSESFKIHYKEHCLRTYGVSHPTQLPLQQNKRRATMIARYGAGSTLQSDVLRAQVLATNNKRYGSNNPSGNKKIREKARKTMLRKYGVEHALQNPVLFEKAQRNAHRVHSITLRGKTFNYQGYEGHVLKILVNQLGIPVNHITTKLTQQQEIWWKGKKKTTRNPDPKSSWHHYSTDIRVKHKGKDISIEVKSNYYSGYTNKEIFNQVKAKAKAAFDACVDLRVWVVHPKTKRVVRISDFHSLSQKELAAKLN